MAVSACISARKIAVEDLESFIYGTEYRGGWKKRTFRIPAEGS